jgi:hypothetical protein
MKSEKTVSRFLGAAFLLVILTSLTGGSLFNSAAGSGSISAILVNISNHLTLLRISLLADMANSLGIILLAALLYSVLKKQNEVLALVALGAWLAEAIFYAVGRIGTFALIPLSLEFVRIGAPDHSFYQTLGAFLYDGVARQGTTIHMFFYCAGGILWYFLFYRSKYIPRAISLYGLIAVVVGLVGIAFQFFGYEIPIFVYLPILPFELAIGIWLVLKGIKGASEIKPLKEQNDHDSSSSVTLSA